MRKGRMMIATGRTLAALAPLPDEDAALGELAGVLSEAIDAMTPDERARLLGQVAPALAKVLGELDRRAVRRRGPVPGAGASPLDELRQARARRRS